MSQESFPEYQPLPNDYRTDSSEQPSSDSTGSPKKPVSDQVQDAARGFKSRGKELIEQGNSRRLVVEYQDREVLNLQVTVAAVLGGIIVLASPPIAVIATVGALFAGVRAKITE